MEKSFFEQYKKVAVPALMKQFGIDNIHAAPRVEKIKVGVGVGRILQQQPKAIDVLTEAVAKITGQKPLVTHAKKAIAGFKIREGQVVGLDVTLRGKRMYDFLEKLINVTLARTRDFRGISRKGFDAGGNYSLGLREQSVYPELSQEDLAVNFGSQVTIVIKSGSVEESYQLLKMLGFPFSD